MVTHSGHPEAQPHTCSLPVTSRVLQVIAEKYSTIRHGLVQKQKTMFIEEVVILLGNHCPMITQMPAEEAHLLFFWAGHAIVLISIIGVLCKRQTGTYRVALIS